MRTLGRRPASISFAEPWHVSQLTPDFTCNPCGKTTLAGKRLVNVNGISLASESAFSKASFSGESLNGRLGQSIRSILDGIPARIPDSAPGFRFILNIERSLFDLFVDAPNIFADNADRHQLDSAKENDYGHEGSPARNRCRRT